MQSGRAAGRGVHARGLLVLVKQVLAVCYRSRRLNFTYLCNLFDQIVCNIPGDSHQSSCRSNLNKATHEILAREDSCESYTSNYTSREPQIHDKFRDTTNYRRKLGSKPWGRDAQEFMQGFCGM